MNKQGENKGGVLSRSFYTVKYIKLGFVQVKTGDNRGTRGI